MKDTQTAGAPERLLNDHDVAAIANMHVQTLRNWRPKGIGPKFLKIGSSVRYHPRDLAAWLDSLPRRGGNSMT